MGYPNFSNTASSWLTFGICWCKMITLGYAAAVGNHGIGAVVVPAGWRHGWPPLAKKRPWCHELWRSWCLHSPSVEHLICEAVILGVQIVLWWATVMRDTQWLLNYQCLLFGVFFLLLLSFLLFFLLTHLSTFIGIVTCIPTWNKNRTYLMGKLCCGCSQSRFYGGHSSSISRWPLLSRNWRSHTGYDDINVWGHSRLN